jgi:hypothetical protein
VTTLSYRRAASRFAKRALRPIPTVGRSANAALTLLGGLGLPAVAAALGYWPLAAGGALVIAGLAAWAGIQLQREAMQGELVSLRVDALPAVADPAGTYFMLSFDVHNDGPGSDFDVKAPPHSVVGTTGDGGDDYGTFPLCWQHSEAGESRCWLSKDGAERVDLAVVANDRATVRFIQPGARAAAARLWMTRTPTDSTVTGTIELIDVNRDTRRLFRFVIDLEPSDAPTLTVEPLTVEPTRPAEDGR